MTTDDAIRDIQSRGWSITIHPDRAYLHIPGDTMPDRYSIRELTGPLLATIVATSDRQYRQYGPKRPSPPVDPFLLY